ncbi:MAG: hypothetical protein K6F34_09085 [Lachnospiraceae bacterium]|nr:hypothetical protein [Lachnospiraceae bacterium]
MRAVDSVSLVRWEDQLNLCRQSVEPIEHGKYSVIVENRKNTLTGDVRVVIEDGSREAWRAFFEKVVDKIEGLHLGEDANLDVIGIAFFGDDDGQDDDLPLGEG